MPPLEDSQSKSQPYPNPDWWKGNRDDLDASFFQDAQSMVDDIEKTLTAANPEKPADKIKLLEALIKHYLDLSKNLDQRRSEYLRTGLQMSAIAFAGVGIMSKYINISDLTIISLITSSFILGLLSIASTGMLIVMKYAWQTKSERYHFLKIDATAHPHLGNSWLWFYHGIPGLAKIPFTRSVNKSNSEAADRDGALAFLKGASFYFKKFLSSSEVDILREHLRHTYLLLVHNAYKNKFDRQLTDIISRGTRVTIGITLVSLTLLVGIGICRGVPFKSSTSASITIIPDSSSRSMRLDTGKSHEGAGQHPSRLPMTTVDTPPKKEISKPEREKGGK